MSEALRLAELLECSMSRDISTEVKAAAELRRLSAELEECQAQRRAAFRRIEEQDANEKVLLAQIQGHTQWREKIIKASEQSYGESAVRYKFSLTKSGKCMNTFPKAIDGRWFALVPAEDDGHIGHVARIAELEKVLKDAERYRWLRNESWAGYNMSKGFPHVFTEDGAGNRRMMLAEAAMDQSVDAAMKGTP